MEWSLDPPGNTGAADGVRPSVVPASGQRIAVVGSGISGLAAAYCLAQRHAVTLFEAAPRLGGHTNTVDIEDSGHVFGVDTGFLVFNARTYPNLIALFDALGVAHCESDMSFSVSVGNGALEWAGTSLRTVFAQPRNLVSAPFLSMLGDILRFNRQAHANLAAARRARHSLGALLAAGRYGEPFCAHYLLPMAAAIWSTPSRDILSFPAETFLRFCLNHGLLQIFDRPRWRTVKGGARSYVHAIASRLADVRVATPVRGIRRAATHVDVLTDAGSERYDAVVLATHAPQTLRMLDDATDDERAVLGAFRYQPNTAFLHRDTRLLPRRRRVWSAWNYIDASQAGAAGGAPCVSYLLNQLQPLPVSTPVVVTLNPPAPPAPELEYQRFAYEHPVFDQPAIDAQARLPALQGQRRTWFAGAWTGYGFHEDGLKSALRVAADFGCAPAWAQVAS
ncbi:FAD-dependent oxidoreductase [Ralstonia insidiosa]|uniref:NAD(P)/FAD-dependent oxidoreductase n=1 Tax=Ralstonia insidiosa TaxID=190721 RepID=UPI0009ED4E20|nr:FAD-dependent oxidoreductase [Ralstonia insidiosa]KAB0472107.1 FAD-dependent oxidoreductase [Ralstonia insidiosa]MBY4908316.1 FAD-dependent oxidoreductase [Ralstonia insidiosa]